MSYHIDEIKSTLARVSNEVSLIDMLLQFEKILDNINIFAYENWIKGELVKGPDLNRHWFKTMWMYPRSLRPDPEGGVRLEKYGIKVSYKKDIFECPVTIRSRGDIIDPESKEVRLKKIKVWLVTIVMPRKMIDDQIDIELEDEYNDDVLDVSDGYDEDTESVGDLEGNVSEEEGDILAGEGMGMEGLGEVPQ